MIPCVHCTRRILDRAGVRAFLPPVCMRTTEPEEFEAPYHDEFVTRKFPDPF